MDRMMMTNSSLELAELFNKVRGLSKMEYEYFLDEIIREQAMHVGLLERNQKVIKNKFKTDHSTISNEEYAILYFLNSCCDHISISCMSRNADIKITEEE